jgi:hypothetical protein
LKICLSLKTSTPDLIACCVAFVRINYLLIAILRKFTHAWRVAKAVNN